MTTKTEKLDMYDFVSYDKSPDIKEIIDNLEIVHHKELDKYDRNDDGESRLISMMYSHVQHFGATDYTDHTKDSKAKLLKKILPSVKECHQRGHFYNSDETPVKVLIVKGCVGGYTGWFVYDTGVTGFGHKIAS